LNRDMSTDCEIPKHGHQDPLLNQVGSSFNTFLHVSPNTR
jgi:hypothetical protein